MGYAGSWNEEKLKVNNELGERRQLKKTVRATINRTKYVLGTKPEMVPLFLPSCFVLHLFELISLDLTKHQNLN